MVARNRDRLGILLLSGPLELGSKLSTVLAELKRRKVYGGGALYAAPGDSSAAAGTVTRQGPQQAGSTSVDMSSG